MADNRETIIPMPELDPGDGTKAQLNLATVKTSGGSISSCAHVEYKHAPSASGFTGTSCLLYGDFRKYLTNARGVRGTQKNIDTQHANVFTPGQIETIKAEAVAFYAKKKAEAAA